MSRISYISTEAMLQDSILKSQRGIARLQEMQAEQPELIKLDATNTNSSTSPSPTLAIALAAAAGAVAGAGLMWLVLGG